MGIDGEGQGREYHKYNLLAAVDETGAKKYWVEADELSTVQCLEFILTLPEAAKLFAFSFGYDLTKMLKDLDNRTLYFLMHEDLRQWEGKRQRRGPRPVAWNGFVLNLQRTKFTIQKGKRKRVIWDIWRFFQSKFTTALSNWQIGTKEELERIAAMKDQRGEFDKVSADEKREYCFSECQKLGQLARKLVKAHSDAGLELTNFYGAGSSASAMLKLMGITRQETPDDISDMVARAFFGGRFENSIIGAYPHPVYSYDISSAYPFQLYYLPCLDCGQWRHTTKRADIQQANAALVRYHVRPSNKVSWGPFPYREFTGNICFPTGAKGWIWQAEYMAGERLFPELVEFQEAWVYETHCTHRPFERIPDYYRERINLGKEAAGIVLKLGMNSCYGKLAQSIGVKPPFQSWIWAGMITSGCRAQILEAMGKAKSLDSILMIATDGIYSSERLELPKPLDTGTSDLPKPLGGWEEKYVKKGIFAARPGIYFPLDPTAAELKEVRARGIGKGTLQECWRDIVEAYGKGREVVRVANITRFIGAKSSLSVSGLGTEHIEFKRSKDYGQWIKRPIELSFNPLPKRDAVLSGGRLRVRTVDGESAPYDRSVARKTLDALLLALAELEASEQPDGGDLSEYDE